jgi:hypothetical protein
MVEHTENAECQRCGTSYRLTFSPGDGADGVRWWSACPGCGVLSVNAYPQGTLRAILPRGVVEFDPQDEAQRAALDALSHV